MALIPRSSSWDHFHEKWSDIPKVLELMILFVYDLDDQRTNLLHSSHVFRVGSVPCDLGYALLSNISPYLDFFLGGLCFVRVLWVGVFGYDNCYQETNVTSSSLLSEQSKSSVQKQMSLKLIDHYPPKRRFCYTSHLCHRLSMMSSTLQCSLSSFRSKKICCMLQFGMSTAGHQHC